jgi:hypothetical protein
VEPYRETFVSPLPSGDAATALTLTHLRSFVVQSQTSDLAHAAVQDALRAVPEKNPQAEVSALLAWVRAHYRYTQDPVEVELVRDPRYSLRAIQREGRFFGDCDDASVLLATLLETAGYSTRFVVQGADGEPYQHVLVEVELDGQWTPADVTNRSAALGWRSPALGRVAYERGGPMRGATGRLGQDWEVWGPLDVALPVDDSAAAVGTKYVALPFDWGAAEDTANAAATLAQATQSALAPTAGAMPAGNVTPGGTPTPSAGSFFSDLVSGLSSVAQPALSIAERIGLYRPVTGYDSSGRPIYASTTLPATGTQAGFSALTQTIFGLPVWLVLVGGIGVMVMIGGPTSRRRR